MPVFFPPPNSVSLVEEQRIIALLFYSTDWLTCSAQPVPLNRACNTFFGVNLTLIGSDSTVLCCTVRLFHWHTYILKASPASVAKASPLIPLCPFSERSEYRDLTTTDTLSDFKVNYSLVTIASDYEEAVRIARPRPIFAITHYLITCRLQHRNVLTEFCISAGGVCTPDHATQMFSYSTPLYRYNKRHGSGKTLRSISLELAHSVTKALGTSLGQEVFQSDLIVDPISSW